MTEKTRGGGFWYLVKLQEVVGVVLDDEHVVLPGQLWNRWEETKISLATSCMKSKVCTRSRVGPRTPPASSECSWRRRWGFLRWGWCRGSWGRCCRAFGPRRGPTETKPPSGRQVSCRADRWGRWSSCNRAAGAAGRREGHRRPSYCTCVCVCMCVFVCQRCKYTRENLPLRNIYLPLISPGEGQQMPHNLDNLIAFYLCRVCPVFSVLGRYTKKINKYHF